ncbi:hypothetical protein SBI67_08645 [Mycolicibacterium sp. 120266]|jgi:hypothetical protein|uniref:hypothetical protein n=1 Tax=Mycolicibacterium sp. 120266 TaxID=3090601 RepID=UPI00299EAC6C|nr:hypothetical protein [Mycolicibacterium sp. 120266]MDX1872186.1 hypothetical protein [Mycolicibacterium sp. 120266]
MSKDNPDGDLAGALASRPTDDATYRRRSIPETVVGVLAAALLATACAHENTTAPTTSTTSATATTTTTAQSVLPGVPAFLPQPPANRGRLDLIGYRTAPGPDGSTIATVYFHAPAVALQPLPGASGPPPCDIAPRVTGAGTDHVTVDIDLTFSANSAAANAIMADCWTGDTHRPVVRSYVVGPVPASAKLFTGTPAPDTPLPKLTEPPR